MLQAAELLGGDGALDVQVGDVDLHSAAHEAVGWVHMHIWELAAHCQARMSKAPCMPASSPEPAECHDTNQLTLVMNPLPPRMSLASTLSPRQPCSGASLSFFIPLALSFVPPTLAPPPTNISSCMEALSMRARVS